MYTSTITQYSITQYSTMHPHKAGVHATAPRVHVLYWENLSTAHGSDGME